MSVSNDEREHALSQPYSSRLGLGGLQLWGAFTAVFLLLLISVIMAKFPPLVAYPNHLATISPV